MDETRWGCGTCSPCAGFNASFGCNNGACTVTQCAAGFDDCDHNAATGCEVETDSDIFNCGVCGKHCKFGEQCVTGNCVAMCAAPNTQCGPLCVDLTKSVKACGACNTPCTPAPDQTAACVNGNCVYSQISCAAGQTACGGVCVDTSSDPEHCGDCNQPCKPAPNGPAVCIMGQCQACPAGDLSCGAGLCVDATRDPLNCGACNKICSPSEVCSGSACVPVSQATLATGQGVSGPKVDATDVYFSDFILGTINKVPKAGGAPTIVAMNQGHATAVALDTDYVYWIDDVVGAVKRVKKAGGAPALLSPAAQPANLLVDGTNVYFTNSGDLTLQKVDKAGGVPVVVDIADEFWVLAQNTTHIFYGKADKLNPAAHNLMAAPKAGGPAQVILSCDLNIDGAGATDTDVYALCDGGFVHSVVHRVVGAPTQQTIWTDTQHLFSGMVTSSILTDGQDVYFNTSTGPFELHQCTNAFAAPLVGYASAQVFDADAKYVYWTNQATIGRTLK
jgi:hypothetical protein